MRRPLPFKIRALVAGAGFLMKLGLMPTPEKELVKPHAQRLRGKAPGIACGPGDQTIRTRDLAVEGRGGPIPVRVYTRPDLKPGAPGYLFIHGGGFVNFGLEFTDYVQRGLAARTGCVVVGLSYRLAPEHPFPAGLEDCQDVLRWMAEARPEGMDGDRIAVGGESAGGNLAAALSIWARDNEAPRISHQAIIYPFTDTTLSALDWDSSVMPGVDRSAGEFMVRVYAGEKHAANPLVSILHAELRGLPPALVVSCEYDPLRTDGIKFAEALKRAGVETLHTHYDNMPHGYLLFPRLTRTADDSLDQIAAEAMRHLSAVRSRAHAAQSEMSTGTSGEDIGRPGPWGEGRYQKPGQSVDESVRTPPGIVPDADKRPSTPVTRKDYQSSTKDWPSEEQSESPGGDAG